MHYFNLDHNNTVSWSKLKVPTIKEFKNNLVFFKTKYLYRIAYKLVLCCSTKTQQCSNMFFSTGKKCQKFEGLKRGLFYLAYKTSLEEFMRRISKYLNVPVFCSHLKWLKSTLWCSEINCFRNSEVSKCWNNSLNHRPIIVTHFVCLPTIKAMSNYKLVDTHLLLLWQQKRWGLPLWLLLLLHIWLFKSLSKRRSLF